MYNSLFINKCMLHYYPRHVSSINMPIFRRTNCIHTASGNVKRLHSTPVESKTVCMYVHSVGQKSIGLKFSKSRTGSDVRYSCHHNSSPPLALLLCKTNNPLPAPAHFSGLRAAKHGNKFDGTVRDWRAVAVTVGMKGEDRQTGVCCVSKKGK